MKPMTIPSVASQDGTKVAIFDLSIPDVNERREKRRIAESKTMACRALGISSTTRLETIIRNREHVLMDGRLVTLRYEHPKFEQSCDTRKKT